METKFDFSHVSAEEILVLEEALKARKQELLKDLDRQRAILTGEVIVHKEAAISIEKKTKPDHIHAITEILRQNPKGLTSGQLEEKLQEQKHEIKKNVLHSTLSYMKNSEIISSKLPKGKIKGNLYFPKE